MSLPIRLVLRHAGGIDIPAVDHRLRAVDRRNAADQAASRSAGDVKCLGALLANDFYMASSPFEGEWRGAHYAEESAGDQ
jgi:hypothetical protein